MSGPAGHCASAPTDIVSGASARRNVRVSSPGEAKASRASQSLTTQARPATIPGRRKRTSAVGRITER